MKGQDDDGNWYVQSFSGNETNKLFMNEGGKKFYDLSALAGVDSDADGRGLALLDYDRDGWQDIVLVNANAPQLEIFRNQAGGLESGHYSVAFRLEGGGQEASPSSEWSNSNGYGAKIVLKAGGRTFLREVRCGEGFASQNSETVLIGLGVNKTITSAEVHWPSGKKQILKNVRAGTINWVHEDGGHRVETFKEPVLLKVPKLEKKLTLKISGARKAQTKVFITTATWCPSCKKLLPQISLLRQEFGEDFEFRGLPIDPKDGAKELQDYREQFSPAYEFVEKLSFDERQKISEILQSELGQEVLPSTIVTSAEGKVLWVQRGIPSISDLVGIRTKEEVSPKSLK